MGASQDRPEDRRKALLEGHRRNPLTTSLQGGRILSALMLPWFSLLPPAGFGVITTTGRKTGKRRRRCVRAIRRGARVFLVAIPGPAAAWLKNIQADPHVNLRIRGGNFTAVAREILDTEERRDGSDVYCGTLNWADYFEFVLHWPGRPTPARIKNLHETWFRLGTPVVLELSPVSSHSG
jgi:deazaflavin-dependent oxidoreductase (nitroreductase family)